MEMKEIVRRMKTGKNAMRSSIPKEKYGMLNMVISMLEDFNRGKVQIERFGWKSLKEFAPIYENTDPELYAVLNSF